MLSDGVMLGARELKAMRELPELIFLNGDGAGVTPEHYDLPDSMTIELLQAGASCVVAPMHGVSDRGAAVFAREFFVALTRGARLWEATEQAHAVCIKTMHDFTWAAYQVWGDPDYQLKLDSPDKEPKP